MDMWVVALSHLVAFGLGVATWLPFTIWEGGRVTAPEPTPAHGPRRGLPSKALLLLIAAALVIAIGVQQSLYQRDASRRDACYESWGQDLYASITQRTKANVALEGAREDRDDAVDNIVLLFIAFEREVPRPTQAEQRRRFREVLGSFAEAKSRLESAQRRAEGTRARNPYVNLNCD
jgi:hypothetical protein